MPASGSGVGPLVSGASVMLAAYGFFYNAVKDQIESARKINAHPGTPDQADASYGSVHGAQRTAELLAVVAAVIFSLLLPHAVSEIRDAVKVGFKLRDYSTLDAIFVAMVVGWLGIAVLVASWALELRGKARKIDVERAGLRQSDPS
jgi:hypothetical protein